MKSDTHSYSNPLLLALMLLPTAMLSRVKFNKTELFELKNASN